VRSAALHAVRAALSRGEWPTPLEVGELLRQSDCEPGEARDLVMQYAAATASLRSTAESRLIVELRSSSLGL
jgi:hypothetical protein